MVSRFVLAAALCAAGPVFAQSAPAEGQSDRGDVAPLPTVPVKAQETEPDPKAEKLPLMEVTGSRIPRTNYETISPMLVITRDLVEGSGHENVGELLQDLPIASSSKNRNFNGNGNGQTEFALRGLDPSRMLLLVDGHRWAAGVDEFNTRAVDLNSIPIGIVDHVEILKDGASAIYGADAVAGVVNIVTRRAWAGTEFGWHWRAYTDGVNAEQEYHLTHGEFDPYHSLLLDLSYLDQSRVSAAARDLTSIPKAGTGLTRGSPYTASGHPFFIPEPEVATALQQANQDNCRTPQDQIFTVCDLMLQSGATIGPNDATPPDLATNAQKYRPFVASQDNYNAAPLGSLLTPLERGSVFLKVDWRFRDTLLLTTTALYSRVATEQQLAPTPLVFGDAIGGPDNWRIWVARNNLYNPFGQPIGHHATSTESAVDPGIGPGSGIVFRRLPELGMRVLERHNDVALLRSELDGSAQMFDHVVLTAIGASYNLNRRKQVHHGEIDRAHLQLALGGNPNTTGDPGDVTCDANCEPLNIFGAVTPAMLNYLRLDAADRLRNNNSAAYAEARADLTGWMQAAMGAEYHNDTFAYDPDASILGGFNSSIGPLSPTRGKLSAVEGFGELHFPLQDLAMELMVAGRIADYGIFAPHATAKAGWLWKPIDGLMLRTTWSQAYRPPSVTELYLGVLPSGLEATDPCFGQVDAVAQQHCADEGVSTSNSALKVAGQPITAFTRGNPELVPEVGRMLTAGLAYAPPLPHDLTLYLDYTDLTLQHYIQFLTPEFILDSCYRRPAGTPRPDTCYLVTRNNADEITAIDSKPFNLDQVHMSAYDIGIDWFPAWNEWVPEALRIPGRIVTQFSSQYLARFDLSLPTSAGASVTSYAGTSRLDTVYPRFNARATIAWFGEAWRASWTLRYIRGTDEPCYDGFSPSLRDSGLCSAPDPNLTDGDQSRNQLKDIVYHDLQIGRVFGYGTTEVVFGIWNVFDTDPPVSYSSFANSYPATFYRPPHSRAPYLRVTQQFNPGSWFGD